VKTRDTSNKKRNTGEAFQGISVEVGRGGDEAVVEKNEAKKGEAESSEKKDSPSQGAAAVADGERAASTDFAENGSAFLAECGSDSLGPNAENELSGNASDGGVSAEVAHSGDEAVVEKNEAKKGEAENNEKKNSPSQDTAAVADAGHTSPTNIASSVWNLRSASVIKTVVCLFVRTC